jgi:uncharacterized membrane protein
MQGSEPEREAEARVVGTSPIVPDDEPTSTGLSPRLAGVLAYLFLVITGVVFLVIERDSRFVRFHAMQSTILFGGLLIVQAVLQVIPVIGGVVGFLLGVLGFVLWLHLMYRAWRGQYYKLPWIGDRAEEFSS